MRSTCTLSVFLSVDIVNLVSCVPLYRALIPRYYFNSESQRCEQFNYGGCEGNENNFQSLEECRTVCSGPPSLRVHWPSVQVLPLCVHWPSVQVLPVYVYIGRLFRSSQSMCTLAVCSGPPSLCTLAVCSGPPTLCTLAVCSGPPSLCTLAVCSGPPSLRVHWPSVQVLPLCVHWPSVQVLPVYVYIGRLFRSSQSTCTLAVCSGPPTLCTLAVCSGPPSLCVHWHKL